MPKVKFCSEKEKNAYRSGTYGFPGGRIEKQEKALAAAKRELEEETGLMAKTLRYVGVVKEWQKSFTFIHFIYECTEWEGDVMLKEPEKCEAWEWFDEKSLPEEILPGHYQGLELIKSDIGGLRDLV